MCYASSVLILHILNSAQYVVYLSSQNVSGKQQQPETWFPVCFGLSPPPPNQPPSPPNQGDVRERMTRSIFHNDGASASNSEAPPPTAGADFVPIGDRTFPVVTRYTGEGKKQMQSKSESK